MKKPNSINTITTQFGHSWKMKRKVMCQCYKNVENNIINTQKKNDAFFKVAHMTT